MDESAVMAIRNADKAGKSRLQFDVMLVFMALFCRGSA
jgi:hypothetical protein